MGALATLLPIVLNALLAALAKFLIDKITLRDQERHDFDLGAAQSSLKGTKDADQAITIATQARAAARNAAIRDPSSILREDDGFQRHD